MHELAGVRPEEDISSWKITGEDTTVTMDMALMQEANNYDLSNESCVHNAELILDLSASTKPAATVLVHEAAAPRDEKSVEEAGEALPFEWIRHTDWCGYNDDDEEGEDVAEPQAQRTASTPTADAQPAAAAPDEIDIFDAASPREQQPCRRDQIKAFLQRVSGSRMFLCLTTSNRDSQ